MSEGELVVSLDRDESNRQAAQRLAAASPFLVDLRPAIEVVPGMSETTVLTAGLPLRWDDYAGLQRRRILEAAVQEGLAASAEQADQRIAAGEIAVASSYQQGCIGPGLALCTASTPVFVVENREGGHRAFCALRGPDLRLGAAAGDERLLDEVVVPVVREAIEQIGGLPLQPILSAALRLGDELHMRSGAATTLFTSNLFAALLDVAKRREADVRATLAFLERTGAAWFVRLALAAARAMGDAAHGIAGSTVVTAVIQSCSESAIRVSGLGDQWFRGPLPAVEGTPADNPGGDAVLADAVSLGDPTPKRRDDGDPGELAYWGMKPGVDLFKVMGTGVAPALTAHSWTARGALVGGLVARVPLACFEAASEAYRRQYSRRASPP
jgi:hypothetical protein